jgi:dTDP-4-dehydrorhamnose reductase
MKPSALRILVLGARGRLGGTLVRRCLACGMEVIPMGRADVDLLNVADITAKLRLPKFDAVVNAAGITSVDYCESHPEEAHAANATGPEAIARVCQERGARFIQISTDYVFSGAEPGLRKESDPTGPTSVYGQSKLDGERLVLDACPGALIPRVSWLFGREGKPSFPDMIIDRALRSDQVSAVDDKWSCPTYAEDLADWLMPFLHEYADVSGPLHLCNSGMCSWQEYAQKALDLAADTLNLPVKTRSVTGHTMHGFAEFKAKRPPHTAMSTEAFTSVSGITPRAWQEALEEYLRLKYTGSR